MVRPTSKVPHDVEMIPELAVRNSTDETYHVGVSAGVFHLPFLNIPRGFEESPHYPLSLPRLLCHLGIASTITLNSLRSSAQTSLLLKTPKLTYMC